MYIICWRDAKGIYSPLHKIYSSEEEAKEFCNNLNKATAFTVYTVFKVTVA